MLTKFELISPSCFCGAEFCYVCGMEWDTCECSEGCDFDDIDEPADVAPVQAQAPTAIMQEDLVVGVRGLFDVEQLGQFPGEDDLLAQDPMQATGMRLSLLTAELAIARDLVAEIRLLRRDYGEARWPGQNGNPRLVEQMLVGLREEAYELGSQTTNHIYMLIDMEHRAFAYQGAIYEQLDISQEYSRQLLTEENEARHPGFNPPGPDHP